MMRSMVNEFDGWKFYQSTFDTKTGTIVRVIEMPDYNDNQYDDIVKLHPTFKKLNRYSPESTEIKHWETQVESFRNRFRREDSQNK